MSDDTKPATTRRIGSYEFVLVVAVLVIISLLALEFSLRPSEESKGIILPVITGLLGFLGNPKNW